VIGIGGQVRELIGNPLVVRALLLNRRGGIVRRLAPPIVITALASTIAGILMGGLPARLYIDELAIWIGVPAFLYLGMAQYLGFQKYFADALPMELQASRLSHAEIVGGLYVGSLAPALSALAIATTLLPRFREAVVEVGWTAYALFAISFLCTFELTARLVYLLVFLCRGMALFSLVLAASFAGFLMIYGLAGVLRVLPDDWIVTPLAVAILGALFAVTNVLTWRRYIDGVAFLYGRRIRFLLEDDPAEVDTPPFKTYSD